MRLFVAVPVPEEIRRKISTLGREIAQDGVSPVRPDNMHLTLKFIGEVGEGEVREIREKLGGVRFGSFRCTLHGAGAFPSQSFIRVLWAGAESGGALEELAGKVIGALSGFGKDERFTAHITIARVKRKIDFSEFLELHKNEDFGSFEVSRFELIESVLGGNRGPEYRVVDVYEAGK